jgi:hypothetical protein
MTKEEFLAFLKDFQTNTERFENNTLELFLEALYRYSEDLDKYYANTNQNINLNKVDWNVFYDLLKGASMYE